jgi:hypothetical protein
MGQDPGFVIDAAVLLHTAVLLHENLVVCLRQQFDAIGPPQHHAQRRIHNEVCQRSTQHLILVVVFPPLEAGYLRDERTDKSDR